MQTTSPHPEEFSDLLIALTDGDIEPRQFDRLQLLLMGDEDAQRYFRRYMRLCAMLEFERAAGLDGEAGGSGQGVQSRESRVESESISGQWSVAREWRVECGEWRVESGIQRPKTQDLRPDFLNLQIPKSQNPQIPALHSPLSTLHSWAFSYAVATLLLSIALLGAWFHTITHPDADSLLVDNRRVTPSGDATKDTSQFTFVGKVSGMVDCQFADSSTATHAGAGVTLNRRYALKSGLMEITYDTGAKVILQGPCDYTVESPSSGFLGLGKLVAKVESQESRVESKAEHSQSALTLALSQGERGPNFTSSRLSTLNSRLFAVRTPTAVVEDLGTEFGVEVAESGATASHVFQGRVVMRTEGRGERGEGRETDNNKSEIRNKKSEFLLSAGQSARVERDAKSGEVKLASSDMPARPADFVRELPRIKKTPLDVAAKKTVVKWSGVYRYGDPTKGTSDWSVLERFGVWHVNDGVTDESEHGNSYWIGRERTPDEYFIIYLAGRFEVERIELMNTHNSHFNNCGTKDFEIWAADEVDGENELVAPRLALKGVLPCRFEAAGQIPYDVFSADKGDFTRFHARYIKFVAKTYYEGADTGCCGLNEIRVFAAPSANRKEQPAESQPRKGGSPR